ncbi:MAG: TolC family outer membrane protein [Gammaproteobacteria bacterium]|nr:TolC family outer membrane protein [Gammaproteobacteria bacterium]
MKQLFVRHRPLFAALAWLSAASVQAADLVSIYEKALAYDSGLAAARAGYEAEQAGEVQARATLLPQVFGVGQLGHTDRMAGKGAADDSWVSSGYGINLSQPLFRASNWFAYEASKRNTERAEAEYSLAQQRLILDVAAAYFGVLRAQDVLTTAKATEAALQRQWEQARERYDVGLIAITEVHEARASYDATKTQRIGAESALDIARETLARLTGEYYEQLNKLERNFPIAQPEPLDPQQWETTALEQNWSIKAARLALETVQTQVEVQKAGHLPTLDLNAGIQRAVTNGPFPVDARQTDTSLSLNLNVPLYQGGGTDASVRRARAQAEQSRQVLDTTRRNVRLDARSQFRSITNNVETVSALEQTIVSRRSALDATRAGYSVGTRNIVEVLDAEKNYYIALSDYANARYDYILNGLRLKLTAGTLSPQDLAELDRWLSANAPGIEALANEGSP